MDKVGYADLHRGADLVLGSEGLLAAEEEKEFGEF
jgi:hypothetical protein